MIFLCNVLNGALLAEVCQFSTVFLSQLLWADRGFGPGALTVAYLALTAAGLCCAGAVLFEAGFRAQSTQ